MAGSSGSALAIQVSAAGALGSLPCASIDADKARSEIGVIRQRTDKPFNVNFFCHTPPEADPARDAAWKASLSGYYAELGLDPDAPAPDLNRAPFDDTMCAIVEDLRPTVVSFHFGLPEDSLLARVKAAGCLVISSATTPEEARWLEAKGCDAIIAQGVEAGGHRGMFLTEDLSTQAGTFALVPQVVDAVSVPVVAAGGIGDGRGIAAALALGASGVQMGTAYLLTPESLVNDLYRSALKGGRGDATALTNLFSGRPARGIVNRLMREKGPISGTAPAFPRAGGAVAPLKAQAEAQGSTDFTQLWAGQTVALGREVGAGDLTRQFADDALARLGAIAPPG